MALEQMGLGAILMLDPAKLEAGVNRGKRSFQGLQTSASQTGTKIESSLSKAFNRIKASAKSISDGLRQFSMAGLPAAAAMGAGAFQAIQYEKQLSSIKAVMRDISDEEMKILIDKTKQLGIESVFSATQSAVAMEKLGILGFNTSEILSAVGPTLDAAAVAGIELGEAAQFIGGVTRAMGLEVKEATRVADALTVASQKSATTLPEMAEAIAYGASGAIKWGMSLEETVAVLGKLADKMHKSTTGGMLLRNIVDRLVNPTSEAKKAMEQLGVSLVKTDNSGFRPLVDVVSDFHEALDKIPDFAERARIESVLFPQRASRAYIALAKTGSVATKELQKNIVDGMGASTEAAEIKLDNLHGAFILFKSSMESLAIGIFGPFLESGKAAFKSVTESLNHFLYALKDLREPMKENETQWMRLQEVSDKYGESTTQRVIGLEKGLKNLSTIMSEIHWVLHRIGLISGEAFGDSPKAKMMEYGVTLAGISAALVSLGIAFWPIKMAVVGLWKVFSGFFGFLLTLLAPLKTAFIAVGSAIRFAFAQGITRLVVTGLFNITTWLVTATAAVKAFFLSLTVGVVAATAAVGLVVAAVGALVAALFYFKREKQSWGNYIKELWMNIVNMIVDGIDWLVKKFNFARLRFAQFMDTLGIGDWKDEVDSALRAAYYVPPKKKIAVTVHEEIKRGYVDNIPERMKQESRIFKTHKAELETKDLSPEKYILEAEKNSGKFMMDLAKQIGISHEHLKESAGKAAEAAEAAADSVNKEKCTRINIDGREVAKANSKAERDIQRRGGREKNWQPGTVVYHGGMPVAR